ncbi:MAG: uroporphyrinogen-III synthase [Chloroflexota bacterium]|nr:uroporphyrinogen-III synthase [Chloroflexota bacterium]
MSDHTALEGKGIVVTRALNQAASLERALRDRGAVPISYPCIAIKQPSDTRELDAQLSDLARFEILLLTSANVVTIIADRLQALELEPEWSRIRLAVVGKATEEALREQLGPAADFSPAAATGDALARALPIESGSRVLLPQSTVAGDYLAELLRERGAQVSKVIAYETGMGEGGADLPSLIADGAVDALTFVSPSAARNFTRRCPLPAAKALPAACLGPVTAERSAQLGFTVVIAPSVTGAEAMLDALNAYFAGGVDIASP